MFTVREMLCARLLYCTHLYLVLDFSGVLQLVSQSKLYRPPETAFFLHAVYAQKKF